MNGRAKAWEKVFIDFMKNYTVHQPNMSIAFVAEVTSPGSTSVVCEISGASEGVFYI